MDTAENFYRDNHFDEATIFIKTDETIQKKTPTGINFGKDPRVIIALNSI